VLYVAVLEVVDVVLDIGMDIEELLIALVVELLV